MNAVVCTNFPGKEPHGDVGGLDNVVTSGTMGGVMVSKLAWMQWMWVRFPLIGTPFPIFITSTIIDNVTNP